MNKSKIYLITVADKLSFNTKLNKMSISKKIQEGKLVAPGKFSLSGVIQRTPQERLIELQQLYNSMEYEQDTNENRMKCNCYMDEINEIVKLYPELSNSVQLKNYGF